MIDSFHRRLLRDAVHNVKWPKIMKNEDVYKKANVIPWSRVVKKRQLSWFGHLMRLPDGTPAKLSLDYALNHRTSRPRGRQKITWISMMEKRFIERNSTWNEAAQIALNRDRWKDFMSSFPET